MTMEYGARKCSWVSSRDTKMWILKKVSTETSLRWVGFVCGQVINEICGIFSVTCSIVKLLKWVLYSTLLKNTMTHHYYPFCFIPNTMTQHLLIAYFLPNFLQFLQFFKNFRKIDKYEIWNLRKITLFGQGQVCSK